MPNTQIKLIYSSTFIRLFQRFSVSLSSLISNACKIKYYEYTAILEYILAVDTYRHFAKAAEHCRVTQPTLSMMIQKLEDELGIKLFDRNLAANPPHTCRT